MSSAPKDQQAPAGPPPEKKRAKGPIVTPQALAIAFGLIIIILIGVFFGVVVKKINERNAELTSREQTADLNIKTYTKKKDKLEDARNIKYVLRDKLNNLQYLFLGNQETVLPFWEDTLLPLLEGSRLFQRAGVLIKVDAYTFHVNPAMTPTDTLPRSAFFEDTVKFFPVEYEGEKNGIPVEQPLTTYYPDFLEPYTITFEDMYGTYEEAQNFVEKLQKVSNDKIITVHCLANDKGDNVYGYRTITKWTFVVTVYFMNPEGPAGSDSPPEPPGSLSC